MYEKRPIVKMHFAPFAFMLIFAALLGHLGNGPYTGRVLCILIGFPAAIAAVLKALDLWIFPGRIFNHEE
jgi:hypothetical protein